MGLERTLNLPHFRSGGEAQMASVLDPIKDRDLAQRIATSLQPYPKKSVKLLENISMEFNGVLHDVVVVHIKRKAVDGAVEQFVDTYCSHSLQFYADQGDSDGQPLITGLGRLPIDPCPLRDTIKVIRRNELLKEYLTRYAPDDLTTIRPKYIPTVILDLLQRHGNYEWLGSETTELNVNDIAQTLNLSLEDVKRYCSILELHGEIVLDGVVPTLNAERKDVAFPTRLYGAYTNRTVVSDLVFIDISIPASYAEPQLFRIRVENSGELYDDQVLPLLKPIMPNGKVSPADEQNLWAALAENFDRWSAPYGGSLSLEYSNDDSYTHDPTPHDPSKHGALFYDEYGWWGCSWCNHGGETELSDPSDHSCVIDWEPHSAEETEFGGVPYYDEFAYTD